MSLLNCSYDFLKRHISTSTNWGFSTSQLYSFFLVFYSISTKIRLLHLQIYMHFFQLKKQNLCATTPNQVIKNFSVLWNSTLSKKRNQKYSHNKPEGREKIRKSWNHFLNYHRVHFSNFHKWWLSHGLFTSKMDFLINTKKIVIFALTIRSTKGSSSAH